jgi:hypothetical protein
VLSEHAPHPASVAYGTALRNITREHVTSGVNDIHASLEASPQPVTLESQYEIRVFSRTEKRMRTRSDPFVEANFGRDRAAPEE